MKVSWLVLVLLAGGGAAVVSDQVLTDGKVILKAVPYQGQDTRQDGASIRSPSANARTIDLDTLNIARPSQKNRTDSKITAQREVSDSDYHEENLPVITRRATNRDPHGPPPQQPESPGSGHGPDVDDVSTSASHGAETRNPASANRAIAGMGVGLVSVMLIFTVFL
ncbi:uncharacterized protein B0H64DRAFT_209349 [Chaetomium fimeti]|uniref:Uncharacterized protein n=1 Tax=Chaetomium fimeti TaxID=1854472 RepID=A0AAE0HCT7_9PEZI|nr:hypothetical protein B0H64DRAFT_209349 [Chaetomium fimeti]